MTPEKIRAAVIECKEFQRRATIVLAETHKTTGEYKHEWVTIGANSGALRRQSLELSRSLSEVRKS